MHAWKIHYFLFLGVIMLAAKPFVGFHLVKQVKDGRPIGICVKAFTKRKLEYVEDSSYDMATFQKLLANPLPRFIILYSFLLNFLAASLFIRVRQVTTGILSNIHLSLFPPLHRYLLSGKLII
jgi:hypothetical protein